MREELGKLAKLGGIYSVASMFERALQFFFIPLYTAYLIPYDYGVVSLLTVTIALTAKVVVTPITSGFNRYYYSPEYDGKGGSLLFNSLIVLAVQALILSIVFYVISGVVAKYLLDSEVLIYAVQLYAIILFFDPISSYFLNYLKQREKARYLIFVSWFRFLASAGTILLCLIYFRLGLYALIYGSIIGAVFSTILVLPMWWRESDKIISLKIMKKPLAYGYPLIPSGVSNFLIQMGDRYIIRLFMPIASVGLYSFSCQLAGMINIALNFPIKRALHPIFFKQERNPEKQKIFLKKSCTYYYVIGMYVCLILSIFSKDVVEIMARNKEYWQSWTLIPLISLSYLQHGLGTFVGLGAVMAKKSIHLGGSVIIAVLINIVLNIIFVPRWGLIGAAFATLIAYTFWNVLKMYYSAKYYEQYFDIMRLSIVTLVGIAIYCVAVFLTAYLTGYSSIVVRSMLIIAYPFIFYLTPFFSANEKSEVRGLMRTLYYKIRSKLGNIERGAEA